MSARRRDSGKASRLVWGGVGVLLLLVLGASFLMMGRARDDAEADAQLRAEQFAVSVITPELTPELVSKDILGPDYRALLATVQEGMAAEPNVVRVRIWKPDGDLIFSTAARDDIEEFNAVNDPQIAAAADGQTVSIVAEADAAPPAGLEGSDEKLFVTYVPLQFTNDADPSGVIEVDQGYAAIDEEANKLWRPVQIGVAAALILLAVLFAFSQRSSRSRSSRWEPKQASGLEGRAPAEGRRGPGLRRRARGARRRGAPGRRRAPARGGHEGRDAAGGSRASRGGGAQAPCRAGRA